MRVSDLIKQLQALPDQELVCTAVITDPGSHECTVHLIELDGRVYLTMVAVPKAPDEELY